MMSDLTDALKGLIDEGLGNGTGNEHPEAEGDAAGVAAQARRQTKGTLRQVGGKVKETLGDMSVNERLEAEGRADRLYGRADRLGQASAPLPVGFCKMAVVSTRLTGARRVFRLS